MHGGAALRIRFQQLQQRQLRSFFSSGQYGIKQELPVELFPKYLRFRPDEGHFRARPEQCRVQRSPVGEVLRLFHHQVAHLGQHGGGQVGVAGVFEVAAQAAQVVRHHRVGAGNDVVEQLLFAHDERLRAAVGVEKLRFAGVEEVAEDVLGQRLRLTQPLFSESDFVEADISLHDQRVVFQEAADAGAAVLAGAVQPRAVAQVGLDEAGVVLGHGQEFGLGEGAVGISEALQHEGVPAGEHLVVEAGPDADGAHGHDFLLPARHQLGQYAGGQLVGCGEGCVSFAAMQDVAAVLPVAGRRAVVVVGK